MNKQRRDESVSKMKTHMNKGGSVHGDMGLVGEKTKGSHNSYDGTSGKAVDSMLRGEHPTTHMATVRCAKG